MKTMRVTTALYILVSCVPLAWSGTHPDGISKVSREQDALGNYKFSYTVSNAEGEHFRKEGTDPLGRIVGSYGLAHADGTHRVVDYVADKDGFRAEIRSNEPGVLSSEVAADAAPALVRLQPDLPLAAAATSLDSSGAVFGARLKTDASKVSYVSQEEEESPRVDYSARQRNYEDYRPRHPVAYYPGSAGHGDRSPNPPPAARTPVDSPENSRSPASGESRPLDAYLPPLDPNSALRRTPYLISRERPTDSSYGATSRRPFLPPYGGFDDDPLPVDRRPGLSMSTVHGGLGSDDFHPPRTSTPAYGAGRYPSDDTPLSRDFIRPNFPPRSNFPPLPQLPGGFVSTPQRNGPGPAFGPPSYDPAVSTPVRNGPGPSAFGPPSYDAALRPNFVLRAVPIPNGIQAVRVDPETGRVYDRLMYPLFLRDGLPVYDRNVLLHNDDGPDVESVRNRDPGYLDIPFARRPPFRTIRNPAFDVNEEYGNVTRQFNRTFDPFALSVPTARDLAWLQRQLSQVEGFDRSRFSNPSITGSNQFENGEFPSFNDFDDSSEEGDRDGEDRPYSRIRNSEYSRDNSIGRNLRLIDRLTPEDTKEVVSKSESLISNAKPAETNPKSSAVRKE